MRELNITANDANQRLNKYLLKYLDASTSSFIYKMLRKKNIVLNDKKADGSEILKAGDNVKLYLSEETIDKFKKVHLRQNANTVNTADTAKLGDLKILYKNEYFMAVHKDAGTLSQKAKAKDYSINEQICDYCFENNLVENNGENTFKPSVCNRLDRNTSGIILAGISLKGSQILTEMLKKRDLDKYYFAIIKGNFSGNIHENGYIHKDYPENKSKIIKKYEYNKLSSAEKKEYSYIETSFNCLASNNGISLLKIKLITGKSHQIRAHLKALGYPIAGDNKYGDVTFNRYMRDKYKVKCQLLHAGEIYIDISRFSDDENKKLLKISDPLPEIFEKVCKGEHIVWEPGTQGDLEVQH